MVKRMTEKTAIRLNDDEIQDNLGRLIRLKEVNGKSRIAFYRALGSKDSGNIGVIMEYWPVMAVDTIDGKPMGSIKGLIDIEMIHGELEKSNAPDLVNEWLTKKAQERAENEKEVQETLKK